MRKRAEQMCLLLKLGSRVCQPLAIQVPLAHLFDRNMLLSKPCIYRLIYSPHTTSARLLHNHITLL